ncbi:MAG: hypothetical protein IK095_05530, partial [Oscillospiraceae bacterium]|nr:hypothetical protein [Oscillospiraceae bacterium]
YVQLALPQMKSMLGQMGVQDIQVETGTIVFAGTERDSTLVTGTVNGIQIYERMVHIKIGNYMASVTAFSMQEGRVDEILALFQAA